MSRLPRSRRFACAAALSLVVTSGAPVVAQSDPEFAPKSLARAALETLDEEFRTALEEYFRPYAEAEDDAARERVVLDPTQDPVLRFVPRYMALAKEHSGSAEAVRAWMWVFRSGQRTPRAQDAVHEAVEQLLETYRDHVALAEEIRFAHYANASETSQRLLQGLRERSGRRETRVAAGYALARLALDGPERDEARARTLLTSVAEEGADLALRHSRTYGEQATADLYELDHCSVGRPVPDIIGEDLGGEPLRLSDHRGRVILLFFWGHWCGPCRTMIPHVRSLAEKHGDEALSLLGVNSDPDRDRVRALVSRHEIPGRSFWDGGGTDGPIARRWNIRAWPTVVLIDHRGVIRFRDPQGPEELERRVEELLAAARDDAEE